MKNENYELFLQAKLLIKNCNYKEALSIFQKLYELEPTDHVIKFELARLYIKENETLENGKQMLIELLDTTSKNYAILELGKLEVNCKKYEAAKKYFIELISTPSRNYAILELGRLEMLTGHPKKARHYFKKILETKSRSYAMLELGKLEASQGNNELARMYLEELINTKSQNMEYAMLEIGKLEVSEGNDEIGRKYFESLLGTKNIDYALSELLFLDIKEEKFADAIYRINKLKKVPSEHKIDLFNVIFYLKYRLGNLDNIKPLNDFQRLLLSYDYDLVIKHIKSHLDANGEKRLHTIFNENIDIEELYNYILEKIQNISPIRCNLVEKYIVMCEQNIAIVNNEETNYIEVITLPNSKKILTFYPIKLDKIDNIKSKQKVNIKK